MHWRFSLADHTRNLISVYVFVDHARFDYVAFPKNAHLSKLVHLCVKQRQRVALRVLGNDTPVLLLNTCQSRFPLVRLLLVLAKGKLFHQMHLMCHQ